jgi:hypothetical protein
MKATELIAQLAVASLALYALSRVQVGIQIGYRTEPDEDKRGPIAQDNVGFVMPMQGEDDE